MSEINLTQETIKKELEWREKMEKEKPQVCGICGGELVIRTTIECIDCDIKWRGEND